MEQGINLLNLSPCHNVYSVPPKQKKDYGRPSGGLVMCVRSNLSSDLLDSEGYYLAVRVNNVAIINVYLPTDYRDDNQNVASQLVCLNFLNAWKRLVKERKARHWLENQ